MLKETDYVILGAGLSGLACAVTLSRQGHKVLVIDSHSQVGGRVQTEKTLDGFVLDAGFQVLVTSYPELDHFLDLSQLQLKKFNSGALIFNGQKLELLANPLLHPETLLAGIFQELMTSKDKALVLKLIVRTQFLKNEDSVSDLTNSKISTAQYLNDYGFSQSFIENFWRPFLTGVFLDPELKIGSDYFEFLIKCFSSGKVAIPQSGMNAIPQQMAQLIGKDSLLLNESVESWTQNEVILKSGKIIKAKKIICAFDPGINSSSKYYPVTTIYFSGADLTKTNWNKWLILVPQSYNFKINHLCVISSVSTMYTESEPLLSVSIVGDKKYEIENIEDEINQLAGQKLNLKHIKTVNVKKALPQNIQSGPGFGIKEEVIYCGDQWCSPSINGALQSGRLAAEYILSQI